MSLIEQATKRLEELRRAGVQIPWDADTSEPAVAHSTAKTASDLQALEAAAQAMERKTGEPARPPRTSQVCALDLARLESNGFLVPSVVRSGLAAEFRLIKRPLLKLAREKNEGTRNNVIMVTSAVDGEGKSFCAINLAMSIAMEVDSSVLLMDADVVRPAVLAQLGLPPGRGLLDLLRDPALELADVMQKTNVPKLTLLPAGTADGKSTELLASSAMEHLLDELATRYPDRIVVMDAPPLLLTTESRVLASRVGQIVMVVEASQTSQSAVAEAFAAVGQCPNVSAILNKCAGSFGPGAYGYYGY